MKSHAGRALNASCAIAACALAACAAAPAAGPQVAFKVHRVASFRGEPCGVGDFDGDGRLDIVAGDSLYIAPDWKALKFRTVKGEVDAKGMGYLWDFMNLPLDVDGDGRLDVVTCDWFQKCAEWYRNPGPAGGPWQRTLIEENGNFECGDLWDIDGDGRALEILPHVPRTVWYEVVRRPDGSRAFAVHVVSEKPLEYGGGAGDINGDNRPDIIRPNAWFEAPADPRTGAWREHPLPLGGAKEGTVDHVPQIWVYDVNADGRNDIVTSSAHNRGIYWYEQTAEANVWKRHLIDDTWTQAHSLALADLDADGDLDLVAGKRFLAHNGGDPGAFDPLCVYWYELARGAAPVWTRHTVSAGEGIGSGMNIPVVDFDGDGDLDIVVTGKWGGPVWFENLRR